MKDRVSRKIWISVVATLGLLAVLWLVSTAIAQGPDDRGEGDGGGGLALDGAGVVGPAGGASEIHGFSYQGILEEGGQPANGYYDFTIWLFDAPTLGSGTNLGACTNADPSASLTNYYVEEGLFTFYLICGTWNPDVIVGGTGHWLEVWARPTGEPSWTNVTVDRRQPLSPAPVAFSLYPGAATVGTVSSPSAVFSATQNSTTGFGMYGYAPTVGVYGGGVETGVWGHSYGHQGNRAGVYGDSVVGAGVRGKSSQQHGVYGETNSSTSGYAGYFKNTASGRGLYVETDGFGTTPIIEVGNSGTPFWDREFYVDSNGDVYADRAYHCGLGISDSAGDLDENEIAPCLVDDSDADFAEVLPAADGLEPGDVLVIAPDGRLARSSQPYQPTAVGVYSARPSYVGGAGNLGQDGYAPLAVVGIVPVKASAENGPIVPGDLLTTSSTPGHAMRADGDPSVGTVIGKALEGLEEGTGHIKMLVMLQ